jgi:CubicO group peptidase (beta-lactamase class C family)
MSLLVALLCLAPLQDAPPKADITKLPEADAYLQKLSGFGYSGSFMVVHKGKVVLNKGYGHADREAKIPSAGDTVYDIGSLAKQFTATAIMKLEEQGKLKVSDTLGKFAPDAPADKKKITIEQLLTHTAGINQVPDRYSEISRDELIGSILQRPLRYEPGSSNAYSNEGYAVLAYVVEKASGKDFKTYLREQLFKPAGLKHTGWWGSAMAKVEPRQISKGYDWNNIRQELPKWSGSTWNAIGSGGVTSSPEDMLRWFNALRDGKVIKKSSLERMWTQRVQSEGSAQHYGYGWWVTKTAIGVRLIQHGGDGWASGVAFRYYPDDEVLLIGMCNVRHDLFPTEIRASGGVALALFQRPLPPIPSFDSSVSTQDVSGEYQLGSGGKLKIWNVGGKLHMAGAGQDAVDAIEHTEGDEHKLRTELNQFSLDVHQGADEGKFEAMDRAIGPRNAQMFRDGWPRESASIGEGLGKRISIESLGTYLAGDPSVRNTLLRFNHEKGSRNYLVKWMEDKILAEATTEAPELAATIILQPASKDRLVGWDLKTNKGIQVEILRNGDRVSSIKVSPLTGGDPKIATRK